MKTLGGILKSSLSVVRPSEKLTISQWAAKRRYINVPGAHVGLWSGDKTPYLPEPLDTLGSLDFTAMVFVGPARTGKALPLDTRIPTPTGWTTMGDLRTGDQLFDEQGKICTVTFGTEIMLDHKCYEIEFDDGSRLVADADHKWFVHDIYGAKHSPYAEKVISTDTMASKWRIEKGQGKYRSRYAIPMQGALEISAADLPLDPYTLGAWLGDGSVHGGYLSLNRGDAEHILKEIAAVGYAAEVLPHDAGENVLCCAIHNTDGESLRTVLHTMGLGAREAGKFIPQPYLRASKEQRLRLLQGLLDTDGSVDSRQPAYEFTTVFPRLRDGVSELLNSLGIKHSVAKKDAFYAKGGERKYCQTAYRITFSHYEPELIWTLPRQIAKARATMVGRKLKPSQVNRRWIRSVVEVSSVPVRCIQVDSPNHLFLAGDMMVPTHNTDMMFNWMGYTADNDPADMLIYGMTQSRAEEIGKSEWNKFVAAKRPDEERSIIQRLLRPGKQNVLDKYWLNGTETMFRWPSITELSGKTKPRVWIEDYDRIQPDPDDIDKQGTAFDLARKRTTTFKRFAMTGIEASPGFEVSDPNWIAATPHEAPPTKGILGVYNRGDRRRWYWCCPQCDHKFIPQFKLLCWPDDGENLERSERVYMLCPSGNGCVITPDQKFEMNKSGRWIKEGETWNEDGMITGKARRSEIASFWMEGPAAGFQTWQGLVLNYLDAMDEYRRSGSEGPLKKTMNTDQGVPYEKPKDENARLPEVLKGRAEDWGAGHSFETKEPSVPEWVRFLVATVDIQARSFVVQVTGFGEYGEMTLVDMFKIRTSNRVDDKDSRRPLLPIDPAAHAEDWDMLIPEVIEKTYPLADGSGRRMPIKISGSDSAGKDGFTTNAVAFWQRLRDDPEGRNYHRRFHLLKGDHPRDGQWLRLQSFYDSNTNGNMAFLRGKIPYQRLNSNALKDRLNVILMRSDPGGARFRYPTWAPNFFYTQLCAENRISGKGWVAPSGKRNEAFDLSYYAIALCLMPEMMLDRIKWDEPDRVPGWAKPWAENDFIIQPDGEVIFMSAPLVDRKQLEEAASDWV